MGNKRPIKLSKGVNDYVPVAVNFSTLEKEFDENNVAGFEPSDEGLEQKRMENDLAYEELVVQILFNLEGHEKIIFTFQLLRDSGHQIDHTSFARSIGLSHRQYMRILDDVRQKTILLTYGYATIANQVTKEGSKG